MGSIESYILGNSVLHERFFATAEILAKLVSSAPRAVNMTQLEDATGRSSKELNKLCTGLARAGLVLQEQDATDKWVLNCDPAMITLEDVFRYVLTEQRTKPSTKSAPDRAPNDIDLLVMQAMIAINQSVFKHLRQFSFDRLKISSAGMFPAPRRRFGNPGFDGGYDLQASSYDESIRVSV